MTRTERSQRLTFHVRSNVLWREGRWHCECGYVSSRWTANLYMDDVILAECVADSLRTMLRTAAYWRDAVRSDVSEAEMLGLVRARVEPRQNSPERRAIPRGGRRETDPGR